MTLSAGRRHECAAEAGLPEGPAREATSAPFFILCFG
jgi:hypothetical protein